MAADDALLLAAPAAAALSDPCDVGVLDARVASASARCFISATPGSGKRRSDLSRNLIALAYSPLRKYVRPSSRHFSASSLFICSHIAGHPAQVHRVRTFSLT